MRRGLLVLLAAGALARLAGLMSRSLWFDEAATLYLARRPAWEIPRLVASLEENPPLHYLLAHFWLKLFADPLLGLRLLSALLGVAGVAAFAALTRRLSPRGAGLAVALAASSSFWIHFAQDGRLYALLLLLSLLATLALLRLLEEWTTRRALAYAALCLAGLYTHNFFALLMIGHLAVVAALRPSRPERWFWVSAAALLYAPWTAVVAGQIRLLAKASMLTERLSPSQLAFWTGSMVFDPGFLGFGHEAWTRALGWSVLAAALAAAWAGRRERGVRLALALWLVPLVALRLAEAVTGRGLIQGRYVIFVSPFLFLLLAEGAERAGRAAKAALLALILAGTGVYLASARLADTHLASLADAIRRSPGRRAPVVYLDPYYYLPMRHYYLPERAHHLVGPRAPQAHWEAMPGYRVYLTEAELRRLPVCVVVDPMRRLSRSRLALASGEQIYRALPAD